VSGGERHLLFSARAAIIMPTRSRSAGSCALDVFRKRPTDHANEAPPPGACRCGAIGRIPAGHLRRRTDEDRRGAPRPHPAAIQGRRARRAGTVLQELAEVVGAQQELLQFGDRRG
jgi:hypothetical protein